jgi:hypothetical protein
MYQDVVPYNYSDMNSNGHYVQPILSSTIYWLAWAVFLGVLAGPLAWPGIGYLASGFQMPAQATQRMEPPYRVGQLGALLRPSVNPISSEARHRR